MKVVFLKDHEPYKEGDKVELPPGLTQYLIAVGVAKAVKEKAEIEVVSKKEKEEKSTGKEKHEK